MPVTCHLLQWSLSSPVCLFPRSFELWTRVFISCYPFWCVRARWDASGHCSFPLHFLVPPLLQEQRVGIAVYV